MDHTGRIIVACVGNVLRLDDGFGYAVAERLGDVPPGVEVLESGIGGMMVVQELLVGADGLIIVDAVDRGAAPGTLFVIEPEVEPPSQVGDIHLSNPDKVLSLAGGLGCLPERLLLVGCQPRDVEGMGRRLSPEVERAVDLAVDRIHAILREWTAAPA
ncbi:MAG TPA: hydrogenase maturation protease [Solirubrobacteraceae bacterium]|nr:hydrogenase maturation protease [Solirubrobacteraceae bacterium]